MESIFVIGMLAFVLVIAILVIFTGLPKPIEHELVRSWREELERHNVHVSTKALEHALDTVQGKNEDNIPFELIFSGEDYQSLISRIFETEDSRNSSYGFKQSGIPKDNLATAIYVKKLLDYIKTIQESKRLIGSEYTKNKWSEEANEKWSMLDKEEEESEGIIRSIIHPRYLKEKWFKLSFSNEAILSEKERLLLVDKKLDGAKPRFSMNPDMLSLPVSSPALVEINEFLNEHELPQDLENELKETMTKIQKKLRVQTEKLEKENVIQNANLLNTAAKDFHELS